MLGYVGTINLLMLKLESLDFIKLKLVLEKTFSKGQAYLGPTLESFLENFCLQD